MQTTLRRARTADVPTLQKLINYFADRDVMLPRSLNEIYENLRDYFVIENESEVVGCCALHVTWSDLAEIKGLAVREEYQGKGLADKLINACLEDAKHLGVPRLFVLTYIPDYFQRFGFQRVENAELPQKVWSECIRCPKFPDCGEVSMVLDLAP